MKRLPIILVMLVALTLPLVSGCTWFDNVKVEIPGAALAAMTAEYRDILTFHSFDVVLTNIHTHTDSEMTQDETMANEASFDLVKIIESDEPVPAFSAYLKPGTYYGLEMVFSRIDYASTLENIGTGSYPLNGETGITVNIPVTVTVAETGDTTLSWDFDVYTALTFNSGTTSISGGVAGSITVH